MSVNIRSYQCLDKEIQAGDTVLVIDSEKPWKKPTQTVVESVVEKADGLHCKVAGKARPYVLPRAADGGWLVRSTLQFVPATP